jgi:hypothetical protein
MLPLKKAAFFPKFKNLKMMKKLKLQPAHKVLMISCLMLTGIALFAQSDTIDKLMPAPVKPDLDAYHIPSGWDTPLVVNHTIGSYTNATTLYAGITTYVNLNYMNRYYAITDSFYFDFIVDGSPQATWRRLEANADWYYTFENRAFTFTAGDHELCQGVDGGEEIDESIETNNLYCHTFTWVGTPVAPELLSPEDDAGCQTLSPVLSWNASANATSYHLLVDNNGDYSSPEVDVDVSGTSKDVNGLISNTTYYWKVLAQNPAGPGSYSTSRSFSTGLFSYPAGPEMTSPADEAICQPTNLTLTWNSVTDAVAYGLQIDNDLDFSDAEDYPECIGTSLGISVLLENTQYYWRMHSIGACGDTGSWSDTLSFVTGIGSPDTPSLTGPADNSTDEPLSITITWEAVMNAFSYQFQLDNNEDFSSPLYDEEMTGTSKAVSSLDEGTSYYWHIQANGECSASDWSEVWQFETGSSGPDAITDAESAGYYLGQNCPNPFIGITTIEFSIPVDNPVSIEIMDFQGKLIKSYTGYYAAGKHTLGIDLRGKVQAGVYIYRMKTDNFTDTKLCILR